MFSSPSRWNRRFLGRAVLVGALTAALSGAAVAPASAASASQCNDTRYTWPFCHISLPSIPRISAPGRLALTPKSSVWCSALVVQSSPGYYWGAITVQKHVLRFWPDYWERDYVPVVWTGTRWVQSTQGGYLPVYCDA